MWGHASAPHRCMLLAKLLESHLRRPSDTALQLKQKTWLVWFLACTIAGCCIAIPFSGGEALLVIPCASAMAVSTAAGICIFVTKRAGDGLIDSLLVFLTLCACVFDLHQATMLRPRVWIFGIVALELSLIFQLRLRGLTVLGVITLWVLLTLLESMLRFGLFDIPGTPEYTDRREICHCDKPPCARSGSVTTVDGASMLLIMYIGFFLTRFFADSLLEKQIEMEAAVETVHNAATAMADFDLDRLADILHAREDEDEDDLEECPSECGLPPDLRVEFLHIYNILQEYRPFLPDGLFQKTDAVTPRRRRSEMMSLGGSMVSRSMWGAPPGLRTDDLAGTVDEVMDVDSANEGGGGGDGGLLLPQHSEGSMPQEGGDVTVMFTDIKLSTMLWEIDEDVMRRVLALHTVVVRDVLRRFDGYEVKTIGDSFMAAFECPQRAVACSLRILSNLDAQHWPKQLHSMYGDAFATAPSQRAKSVVAINEILQTCVQGLKLRIGVHCGPVTIEQNPVTLRYDYFGTTVNKAARIESKCIAGTVATSSEVHSRAIGSESRHWRVAATLEQAVHAPLGSVALQGIKGDIQIYCFALQSLPISQYLGELIPLSKQMLAGANLLTSISGNSLPVGESSMLRVQTSTTPRASSTGERGGAEDTASQQESWGGQRASNSMLGMLAHRQSWAGSSVGSTSSARPRGDVVTLERLSACTILTCDMRHVGRYDKSTLQEEAGRLFEEVATLTGFRRSMVSFGSSFTETIPSSSAAETPHLAHLRPGGVPPSSSSMPLPGPSSARSAADMLNGDASQPIVNPALARLITTVGRMGGTVMTVVGNTVVSGYNVGRPCLTHVELAIRTAGVASRIIADSTSGSVKTSFGIATGPGLYGHIGTTSQRFMTVFGQCMKVASTLCQTASDSGIEALYASLTPQTPNNAMCLPSLRPYLRTVDEWAVRCKSGELALLVQQVNIPKLGGPIDAAHDNASPTHLEDSLTKSKFENMSTGLSFASGLPLWGETCSALYAEKEFKPLLEAAVFANDTILAKAALNGLADKHFRGPLYL